MISMRRPSLFLGALVGLLLGVGRVDAADESRPLYKTSYRVINVHLHCFAPGIDAVKAEIEVLDRMGIAADVILDGGDTDGNLPAWMILQKKFPDRFVVFGNVPWGKIKQADFFENLPREITEQHRLGIRGIKIFKELGMSVRDPKGELLKGDDPRLDPLWAKCGELGIPVLIHMADPKEYWYPLTYNSFHYGMRSEAEQHYDRTKMPSFEDLIRQRDNILKKHPKTTFIAPHMGSLSFDLKQLGETLDRYPNFYVDCSARLRIYGRLNPKAVRDFFIKYQDRILFGTDGAAPFHIRPIDTDKVAVWKDRQALFLSRHFEYFETDHLDIPEPGGWGKEWLRLPGIKLPPEVLEKFYHGNAERLIPGLARADKEAKAADRKSSAEGTPETGLTVVRSFPGDSGPGPKDNPDNSGAVGPDHVVDFTNMNVVIHDKKTGKVVKQMTQTEFWKRATPGFDLPKLNDPRLLYDPLSGRWFGVIAELKKLSVGYLAVSESSDPTKGWRAVKLPMEPTDPGMKLGVDRNGLYIAYYVLTGNTHTMMSVHAIPIADAIAADGPSLAHLQTFPNLEIECFPATDLNPRKALDEPAILLHHEFGNSYSRMFMYKITWSGKTATISKMQTIPLSKTYIIPNGSSLKNQAVQPSPGEKLRADEGRRTLCVFQHDGSLYTCNEAKRAIDKRCGIFWCQIRVSDGRLVQEGFVDDPDVDYLVPSLAVDAKGNIGLGCTRTSAKEYPSVVVMMHAASDTTGTMRPPVLAAKGTSIFVGSRTGKFGTPWGNYNATCLDPSDSNLLWTYQQYATSSDPGRYTTCWVAFKRQ
jgi:predicted TIM-barrel fold metal-dependent hydrolase